MEQRCAVTHWVTGPNHSKRQHGHKTMQSKLSEVVILTASYQAVKAKGSTPLLNVWPCSCDRGRHSKVSTLSLRAFSYLAKSLSDLNVELAASHTYLKSFWLMGSFQKASQVTVLSCRTSFHCCPGYGCSGVGSPAPDTGTTTVNRLCSRAQCQENNC